MYVTYASEPTPGRVNEDYVVASQNWVIVLDGATAPKGVDSGCIHDVPWLVRHLAAAMTWSLAVSELSLTDIVAEAIRRVCAEHADTCDLRNPSSPSSTVALMRLREDQVDYLTLADSPIVLDTVSGVRPVIDDRTAHLPSYTIEAVTNCRNQPGGFWVASTRPEAAYEAVHGSIPAAELNRAALLTDGGARYVERFNLTDWAGLVDLLDKSGPRELIRMVRVAETAETDAEREHGKRRGKRHDDATAVLARF